MIYHPLSSFSWTVETCSAIGGDTFQNLIYKRGCLRGNVFVDRPARRRKKQRCLRQLVAGVCYCCCCCKRCCSRCCLLFLLLSRLLLFRMLFVVLSRKLLSAGADAAGLSDCAERYAHQRRRSVLTITPQATRCGGDRGSCGLAVGTWAGDSSCPFLGDVLCLAAYSL